MSDLRDLPPRMDVDNFALAINTKPFNVFHYRTAHALEDVLAPGYFDEAADCLIRKHDRVEVIASADGATEFATLTTGAKPKRWQSRSWSGADGTPHQNRMPAPSNSSL